MRPNGSTGGDLFEDIPATYAEADLEDWCQSRGHRRRDIAIKLQCHMAMLLREAARLRDAMEHADRAPAFDAPTEAANCEMLRVIHPQGRPDALARHLHQYRAGIEALDASVEGSQMQALFRALTSG